MVVYDVRESAARPLLESGARLASSPAEVAQLADTIFTSLPIPQMVEQVVSGGEGVLEGIVEGKTYLDLSTCSPDLLRGLEPLFRQRGAHVLDAPVLSSPMDAIDRDVIVMVGGERDVYDRIRPILDTFADKVVYTGALGTASVCKIVHNMTSLIVQEVVAEGLTLGMKAGVELPVLLESGSRGVIGSMRDRFARTVFPGRFDSPLFTLALARKDIGLATELGRGNNVPLPVANLVEQIMMQAMKRGWAEQDRTIAVTLQEESAVVEIRLQATN
jgi:3-hydroxyisobutyrate dehydrogenase